MTPEIIQLIETIVAVLVGGLLTKFIDYQRDKRKETNKQDNHIIDQLQEEMSSLRERVAKLENQIEVKNDRIVDLEKQKATLEAQCSFKDQRIAELERLLKGDV